MVGLRQGQRGGKVVPPSHCLAQGKASGQYQLGLPKEILEALLQAGSQKGKAESPALPLVLKSGEEESPLFCSCPLPRAVILSLLA